MAARRASLASLESLSVGSMWRLARGSAVSSLVLQSRQRLAKPGLSGLSSNSSPQTAQVLMGKAMT